LIPPAFDPPEDNKYCFAFTNNSMTIQFVNRLPSKFLPASVLVDDQPVLLPTMDASMLDWADDDDNDDTMAATSAPAAAHEASNSLASAAAAAALDSANTIHIQDKSAFPPLSKSHK
jgi:hypothetical protein